MNKTFSKKHCDMIKSQIVLEMASRDDWIYYWV